MISRTDEFELLYEEHRDAAYQLAFRLTGNRAWADDAVQEAMLRIWRAGPEAQGLHSRSWILRIVANECARLRAARRRESKRIRHIAQLPVAKPTDRESIVDRLNRGLEKLPPIESNLLKLRYEIGLSQRSISAVVAIPQQTVSFRLKRAIRGLRDVMSNA